MTDIVFFLKCMPPKAVHDLPWPNDIRFVVLDPPERCGGNDPLCSSAYTRMADAARDASGRVLPGLLARYAGVPDVQRVAFVGYSAGHGLLEPLARHPDDRRDISAYILVDATFGGGKTGYQAYAAEAIQGDHLLATSTANTGGDDGWQLVWNAALAATGASPKDIDPRPPMPAPSGGVRQAGKHLYWYRFVDASNGSELPHWHQPDLIQPFLEAYLLPWWQGKLGGMGLGTKLAIGAAALAVGFGGWELGRRRRAG